MVRGGEMRDDDYSWKEVRSRRNRRYNNNATKPDIATDNRRRMIDETRITTYFFSDIPDSFGANAMFNVFQKYGDVVEVVIPAKRDKGGRRFGFARFDNVWDARRFGIELDNIIIGRDKIYANLSRFQRETGNRRENQRDDGYTHDRRGVRQEHNDEPLRRRKDEVNRVDEKSYAHVLQGDRSLAQPNFKKDPRTVNWGNGDLRNYGEEINLEISNNLNGGENSKNIEEFNVEDSVEIGEVEKSGGVDSGRMGLENQLTQSPISNKTIRSGDQQVKPKSTGPGGNSKKIGGVSKIGSGSLMNGSKTVKPNSLIEKKTEKSLATRKGCCCDSSMPIPSSKAAIKKQEGGEWCLGGDFNAVLKVGERKGSSSLNRQTERWEFRQFVEGMEIIDVPVTGKKFTWFSADGKTMSRLDRFLLSEGFIDKSGVSGQWVGERDISDHCPVWLLCSNLNWGPKPFKFNNCWLEHAEFNRFVEDLWVKMPSKGKKAFVLKEKLKSLKEALKGWNKEVFGVLDMNIESTVKELNEVEGLMASDELVSDIVDRGGLQKRFWEQLHYKESLLKQKSKMKWIQDGDANSRFFHASLKGRRRRNQVVTIKKEDSWIQGVECIKNEVKLHFEKNFVEECVDRPFLSGIGFNSLNDDDNLTLMEPFGEEEVREVIWNCDGNKSPGPDGFNFNFFKACWSTVKHDVMAYLNEFHHSAILPKAITASFLALIPKKDHPQELSDYRPICLIGCLYKILSKILAARLKRVLGKLISGCQSAFLPGRQIMDGVVVLNELIDLAKRRKDECMIFKVDFERAYDTVSWNYLQRMMKTMGFAEGWLKWMKACIFESSMSVLVNGSPTADFKVSKGLRQGDPLSPFLFLIAAEGLTGLVNKAVDIGRFHGFKVKENIQFQILQFADDTVLVGESSWDNVWTIKSILRGFELVSGMRINFVKSKLYGVNVDNHFLEAASNFLLCRAETISFKFLGLPVGANPRRITTWKPIVEAMYKRLSSWNGRHLSIGVRFRYKESVGNLLSWDDGAARSNDSIWWRDILKVGGKENDLWFPKSVSSVLGDGNLIGFWKEKWLGEIPFRELFPKLFNKEVDHNVVVAERLIGQRANRIWGWQWRSALNSEEQDLAASINHLIVSQQSFQLQVSDEIHGLRTRLGPPGFPSPGPIVTPATSIKLDIPRFDGTDPMGWIFKINQFFYYHLTPDEQRLRIASFYMDGDALSWFQWMHSNGQILTWTSFLQALETRFAPSQYDDPKGALFKLCQSGSVRDYQTQFEMLTNRISGLPPQFYLKEKIDDRPSTYPKLSGTTHSHSPSSSSFRPTMTVTPPKSQPTVKRLTPVELQARREKGLCYNCDERYVQVHRCKRTFHLLIVQPDEDVNDSTALQLDGSNEVEQVVDPDPQPDPAQINEEFQQFLIQVQQHPEEFSHYEILDGLLFVKGKLFVPANSPFKQALLEEFHSSPVGGHSGIHRTFGRLQENVFWHGMRKDVTEFVRACGVCQQTKPATHSPYGLLQPLPIPERVWEDISLDFIVGLPSYQTHSVILVVVDRLSKAAHFGTLPTQFTAVRVAELFASMVCKLHGMPRSIVSDRDAIFLSQFWKELFRLSETKLRMSSAYHPQSDGQTEIVSKVLQQYLRCFV
ncbi:unnamed protein product [Trifolium pratense]|uniref:Uncharacterized protein n=1 Tax=Trifolium pratense TaxID=57577 RepID=A0ACB0JH64_TRIPR|nr:unnamed protein product [Trifolium pratense]